MNESTPRWFKSSHSGFASGCVEVAVTGSLTVLVRDTQNRASPVLALEADEWSGLMSLISGR